MNWIDELVRERTRLLDQVQEVMDALRKSGREAEISIDTRSFSDNPFERFQDSKTHFNFKIPEGPPDSEVSS